jgi:hypothetical protein
MLSTREWTTEEAAALLGCTADEAEAILWSTGFVYDAAARRWRYRADQAAELIADDIDLRFADEFSVDDSGYDELIQRRLDEYARTGTTPDTAAHRRSLARQQAREIRRALARQGRLQRLRARIARRLGGPRQ